MRVGFWKVIHLGRIVGTKARKFGIAYFTCGKSSLCDENQGCLRGIVGNEAETGVGVYEKC
jgi:hypothetical protein